MIKTITLDGLTSVKIKQSAFDMERFCWVKNRSDGDIFISCTDVECTESGDNVMKISAGEYGMLDTESYETLYLNGSGTVEIITTAFLVCPFDRGGKGGGSSGGSSGGMKLIGSYAITSSDPGPTSGIVVSDLIELPIDLYEKNRTLLIKMNYNYWQSYTILKVWDYNTIYSPNIFISDNTYPMRVELYYYPETNQFGIIIRSHYYKIASLDVYDLGVIE